VNSPHSSHHAAPGKFTTEFRVSSCGTASTIKVEKWEHTSVSGPGGISGGGDFAWKPVGSIVLQAGKGRALSVYFNEPCTVGDKWTVDMKGRFTINGHQLVMEESGSDTC